MRVMTSLGTLPLRGAGDRAAAAEAAGFDGVTTQENRHDPFLPLAVAAVASETITLATSISIAFARSPMVFANLGCTEASNLSAFVALEAGIMTISKHHVHEKNTNQHR